MQFMAPALLGGLALGAVPIIIHLLNKRRFRVVDWAPMKYLKLSIRTSRRRIKLEQIILLIIRTLFVLLLMLAVARPMVSEQGALSWVGGQSRTYRVIVLDDSLSMAYQVGDLTSFELGRGVARKLIDSMPGRDTLTLLRSSAPEQPLVKETERGALDDPAALLAGIERTDGATTWARVLGEVERLLETAAFPVQEVTLVSDLRAEGWSEDVQSICERLGRDGRTLKIVDVGASSTDNVALVALEQDSAVAVPGVETEFTATIRNDTGDSYGPFTAAIHVGEGSRDLTVPRIEPGVEVQVTFSYTFGDPGVQALMLELPPDALAPDDVRFVSVDVREHLDMILVDGEPGAAPFESETDYLSVSFTIGDVPWRVYMVTDAEWLSSAPPRADLTVLANLSSLTAEHVDALEALVADGMGLMVFPGEQVDTLLYNMLLNKEGEGLLPGVLGDVVQERVQGLVIEAAEDSALRRLADLTPEALGSVEAHTYQEVTLGEAEREHTQVLARWDDPERSPAVLAREWGRGRVLLWTVTADRGWSDWPVMPTFLLAMREAGLRTADHGVQGLNFEAGQTLVIETRERAAGVPEIEAPGALGGRRQLASTTDEETGEVTLSYDGARTAGIWAASWRSEGGELIQRPLAVSPSAAESRLARVAPDELRGWAAALKPVVIHHSDIDALIQGPEREVWRSLLFAVLGLLAIESAFMVWAGRKG